MEPTLTRRGLLAAGVAGGTALAGCQFRAPFERRWAFRTAWPVAYPVVAGGRVLARDPDPLAVAAEDGTELWRLSLDGARTHAPLAFADGRVFGATEGGQVRAVDAADGTELWRREFDATFLGAPSVESDGVHVSASDGTVYALAAADGGDRWRYAPETPPDRLEGLETTRTVAADGTVYLAGYDAVLRALDAVDGTERWRFDAGALVYAPPAIADGTALVCTLGDGCYGVQTADGTERWHNTAPPRLPFSAGIEAEAAYLPLPGTGVTKLAVADGSEKWRADTPSGSRLGVGDGLVAFADSDGALVVLDAAGNRLWRTELEEQFLGRPTVADGTVYAGTDAGMLYAFERR